MTSRRYVVPASASASASAGASGSAAAPQPEREASNLRKALAEMGAEDAAAEASRRASHSATHSAARLSAMRAARDEEARRRRITELARSRGKALARPASASATRGAGKGGRTRTRARASFRTSAGSNGTGSDSSDRRRSSLLPPNSSLPRPLRSALKRGAVALPLPRDEDAARARDMTREWGGSEEAAATAQGTAAVPGTHASADAGAGAAAGADAAADAGADAVLVAGGRGGGRGAIGRYRSSEASSSASSSAPGSAMLARSSARSSFMRSAAAQARLQRDALSRAQPYSQQHTYAGPASASSASSGGPAVAAAVDVTVPKVPPDTATFSGIRGGDRVDGGGEEARPYDFDPYASDGLDAFRGGLAPPTHVQAATHRHRQRHRQRHTPPSLAPLRAVAGTAGTAGGAMAGAHGRHGRHGRHDVARASLTSMSSYRRAKADSRQLLALAKHRAAEAAEAATATRNAAGEVCTGTAAVTATATDSVTAADADADADAHTGPAHTGRGSRGGSSGADAASSTLAPADADADATAGGLDTAAAAAGSRAGRGRGLDRGRGRGLGLGAADLSRAGTLHALLGNGAAEAAALGLRADQAMRGANTDSDASDSDSSYDSAVPVRVTADARSALVPRYLRDDDDDDGDGEGEGDGVVSGVGDGRSDSSSGSEGHPARGRASGNGVGVGRGSTGASASASGMGSGMGSGSGMDRKVSFAPHLVAARQAARAEGLRDIDHRPLQLASLAAAANAASRAEARVDPELEASLAAPESAAHTQMALERLSRGTADDKALVAAWLEAARIFRLAFGRYLARSLRGNTHVGMAASPVYHLAVAHDGRSIATCHHADNAVKLWEAGTARLRRVLSGHEGPPLQAAWSPDDAHVATAGVDKTVRVWHAHTGVEVTVCYRHAEAVSCVAWSGDGRHFVSGGMGGLLAVWSAAAALDKDSPPKVTSDWSGKGKGKGMGKGKGSNRGTRVTSCLAWVVPRAEPGALDGHMAAVRNLCWHPDSRSFVSVGDDCAVKAWSVAAGHEGELLHEYATHRMSVHGVAINQEGDMMATCGKDGTVCVWSLRPGRERLLHVLLGHGAVVHAVAFSPECNGRRLVSVAQNRTLIVWDARGGKSLQRLEAAHMSWLLGAAFTPGGTELMTWAGDGSVKVWVGTTTTEAVGRCLVWSEALARWWRERVLGLPPRGAQ